jgi:hypothetical protein
MKRRTFNQPRAKKYRPTRAEQGIYAVRRVGDDLPTPPDPEQVAKENLAAMKWGGSASVPAWAFVEGLKGIQKRNLRRSDLGKRGSVCA